ncbi:MAG: BtpA/SgcQ family protein [Polyangiales bacterium]
MKIEFPAVFPVIHPVSEDVALRSIAIAIEAGAAGVFLIDQGMPAARMLDLTERVSKLYPQTPVGVNLLRLDPAAAIQAMRQAGARMLWSDQAPTSSAREREDYRLARQANGWDGWDFFFGGVAFKYREPVPRDRIPAAIQDARCQPAVVDVVTTSGDATGSPPDLAKIDIFRRTLGAHEPLAVASGMTPDNVVSHVDAGVDAFLVASGIESSFGHLDPKKTSDFVARVRDRARSGRSISLPDAP